MPPSGGSWATWHDALRLLLGGRERAEHGERGDEGGERCGPHRLPIGLDPAPAEIGLGGGQKARPCVLGRVGRGEVAVPAGEVGDHLAVGRGHGELLDHIEAAETGERDEVSAVLGLGEARDSSEAAHPVDRPPPARPLGLGRLDHPDHSVSSHRVSHHRQIARLENVERQVAAGQQERPLQREDREPGRDTPGRGAHRSGVRRTARSTAFGGP